MNRLRCAMMLVIVAATTPTAHAADGPVVTRESQYNTIYVTQTGTYVSMLFGFNRRLYTESIVNTADPLELPTAYSRFMTLPLAYAETPRRLLEIGLGGGTTASYLFNSFPQLDITIVELDPVVVELAREYFFLPTAGRLKVVVRDGRIFLARSTETFDIILIDAYRAPFVPFHLLTREFFQLVEDHLAPGGAVAQNVEPNTMLFEAALATMKAVFDHVDVYDAAGNAVAIAYNGPSLNRQQLAERAAAIDAAYAPRYPLAAMALQRQVIDTVDARVLTDDFAPVEMLNATERNNLPRPAPN